MDVFKLYKPFRNKVATLSYSDVFYVIWAHLRYLQFGKMEFPKDVEVDEEYLKQHPPQKWIAEWELETITKEVILNGSLESSKGRSLRRWSDLAETVNQLKDLENSIYGLCAPTKDVLIELVRMSHRQFSWLSKPLNPRAMIRYYKIFEHPVINEICMDRMGLSINDIYACGAGFLGSYISRPYVTAPVKSELEGLSDKSIEKFLSFTCRTITELKSQLKSEQRYDDSFAYAYSSLRAYPLIRATYRGHEVIWCPFPTILFWRYTGGLYYALAGDPRFSQAIGEAVQGYVGEAIERACPAPTINLCPEEEYFVGKSRKDTVDWILSDERSALFIECKSKRLSMEGKTGLSDTTALVRDIDKIANAIVQTYKTIGDYREGCYPHFQYLPERKIYPVIVTLENWYLFGPRLMKELKGNVVTKLTNANISQQVLEDMPYSVWAVEDLEIAMQIIDTTGVREFMDGKIADPEMNDWPWKTYMGTRFPDLVQGKNLFSDEFEAFFSRIEGFDDTSA